MDGMKRRDILERFHVSNLDSSKIYRRNASQWSQVGLSSAHQRFAYPSVVGCSADLCSIPGKIRFTV